VENFTGLQSSSSQPRTDTNRYARSLDLTSECFENAGASVLAAGHIMSPAEVVQLMIIYHVTVLSGESSQIVSIVHYISTMPPKERARFKLDKIIYTSEGLTPSQRSHIYRVLGHIKIHSILGSAEAGPYAVSCPQLTGSHWASASYEDFIFDTRMTRIEILPLSFSEYDSCCEPIPDGELGIVAQTSLTRLRNPLVRYITGDVGSIHSLPEDTRAMIHEQDWRHLRVLRLQGRDRRFSFEWDGNYLEFSGLKALMNDPQSGVVLWQVVLDKIEPSLEGSLELRILRPNQSSDAMSEEELIHRIEVFFHVCPPNRHRFKLVFVGDDTMFRRSATGRKIVQFVNNYN
jgi:phenylacetate-coenzyme A ligase PaaK-like adenylate-forming protein